MILMPGGRMMCRVWPRGSPCTLDVQQAQHTAIILPSKTDTLQDRVGFTDLGEAAHDFVVARVPVRVEAEALAVVRRLDLRLCGVRGDPQNVVIRRFTRVKWRVVVAVVVVGSADDQSRTHRLLFLRCAQKKRSESSAHLLTFVMRFLFIFLECPQTKTCPQNADTSY